MSSLWLSIEPTPTETRLMLSRSNVGCVMTAKLPPMPSQPKALAQLLEALVAWFGLPLCAVLDADAQDVQAHPERWADYFGPLASPNISIAWGAPALVNRRDPFIGKLGSFTRAKKLINAAGTGQP
jgi:hypothetical protein